MKRILLPFIAIALAACDASIEVYEGDPFSVLENGPWGFAVDDNACETFQHTFDFSSTKKDFSMHFANLDSKETSKVNYKILSVEGSTLYTDMEGEDRKDKNGNLVSWYLVVNDQNSYCWRRSDWGLNSCTNPITRCLNSRRP